MLFFLAVDFDAEADSVVGKLVGVVRALVQEHHHLDFIVFPVYYLALRNEDWLQVLKHLQHEDVERGREPVVVHCAPKLAVFVEHVQVSELEILAVLVKEVLVQEHIQPLLHFQGQLIENGFVLFCHQSLV